MNIQRFFETALPDCPVVFSATDIRKWQERVGRETVPNHLLAAFQTAGSHSAKTVEHHYAFNRFKDDAAGVQAYEHYTLNKLFQ
jgi:hypothetical protein